MIKILHMGIFLLHKWIFSGWLPSEEYHNQRKSITTITGQILSHLEAEGEHMNTEQDTATAAAKNSLRRIAAVREGRLPLYTVLSNYCFHNQAGADMGTYRAGGQPTIAQKLAELMSL